MITITARNRDRHESFFRSMINQNPKQILIYRGCNISLRSELIQDPEEPHKKYNWLDPKTGTYGRANAVRGCLQQIDLLYQKRYQQEKDAERATFVRDAAIFYDLDSEAYHYKGFTIWVDPNGDKFDQYRFRCDSNTFVTGGGRYLMDVCEQIDEMIEDSFEHKTVIMRTEEKPVGPLDEEPTKTVTLQELHDLEYTAYQKGREDAQAEIRKVLGL